MRANGKRKSSACACVQSQKSQESARVAGSEWQHARAAEARETRMLSQVFHPARQKSINPNQIPLTNRLSTARRCVQKEKETSRSGENSELGT